MEANISNKIHQKLFNIFLILILPIVVLAPMGTWIPLIVLALITLCSVKEYKNITFEKKYIVFLVTFMIVTLLSYAKLNFNIKILSKLLSMYFLFFCFITILSLYEYNISHKSKTIQLSVSFIISYFIIIIDYFYQIGLKLWLSNNLDFKNFNNFYSLKNWVSLSEFKNNNPLVIKEYLNNTYDRGITALSVLAIPIYALCIFNNLRKMAFGILIITLVGLCSFYNITALISFILAFLLFFCLFFISFFKKKILFIFISSYFIFSPFLLGKLDYKNFANYENELNSRYGLLEKKILNDYPLFFSNKYNTEDESKKCCPFYQEAFKVFFSEDNKIPILFHSFSFSILKLEMKILHRRAIWSFSKEKILEKPILGHGIFSSRVIGDQQKIINHDNQILSAIPLHPHNNILQLWLELGIVGIILFFILICKIINKIYKIKKVNEKYAAFGLASLFQLFLIGQFSYGFWQTWWISIIFINIFIYNILYKKLLQVR